MLPALSQNTTISKFFFDNSVLTGYLRKKKGKKAKKGKEIGVRAKVSGQVCPVMLAVVPERCYASNHQLPRGGPHDGHRFLQRRYFIDDFQLGHVLQRMPAVTARSFSLGGWRHINFVIRKKKKKKKIC